VKKIVQNLPLAKILGVDPFKAINFLLVPLGTKVDKGDLIAQRLSLGGLKKKRVISPYSGRLISLKEETGELEFEVEEEGREDKETNQDQEENKQKEVSKLDKKRLASGIFGFGRAQGEGLFLEDTKVGLDDLSEEVKGKVIFCKQIKSKGTIFKLAAFGSLAVVIARMDEEVWQELNEEVRGKVSLAVLVLKDESELKKIDKKKGKFLVDGEGKKLCYIN